MSTYIHTFADTYTTLSCARHFVLVRRIAYSRYGVAMISRLLKIICLFCKKHLSNRLYSARETDKIKEPTNRSNPIL